MPEHRTPPSSVGRRPFIHAARAGLIGVLAGVLAGCANLQAVADAPRPDIATIDPAADDDARSSLHAAVQASQPGGARLADARRVLERLLADESTAARAWHPYARALLEQIRERQRLGALNARLEHEREAIELSAAAHARALAELRRQHDALQHKLDALADIERRLEPPALPATADDADRR